MATADLDSIDTWLAIGIRNGWITEPFCNTHDIDPGMTEEEEQEWENGFDPCQHVVRLKV